MGILKNLFKSLSRKVQKLLPESSEEFFKRVFGIKKDVDIFRELHIYDYNKIVDPDATSVDIKSQITQADLNRIVRERSKLKTLSFYGVDISGLDLSVLAKLTSLKTIEFDRTKFDNKSLETIPPSVVSYWFRNIDFSENPIILPNLENLEYTHIRNCKNISKIENLNEIGGTLVIANSSISDIALDFPNLQNLSISHDTDKGEIESLEKIAKGCPNLRILALYGQPIKNLGFENQEGISFQHLQHLCIKYSPKFTEFGNVEGMFPNVIGLICEDTNLNSIQHISKIFPNLNKINFIYNKSLTDITPLLDYNRGFEIVHLDSSGVDEDMEPVINTLQSLATTVTTNGAKIEKSKKDKLAKQVIIPKGKTLYNGIKKLFFYGTGTPLPEDEDLDDVEITQLDLYEKGQLYKPDVSPRDLLHLQNFPSIAEMITELRIIIPEEFGINADESFVQIIKDLDALKKPANNGRLVAFDITKIPEISEKDKDILSARYGLTFVYKVPISQKYPDYHCKNRNYYKNMHIDEVIAVRTMLDKLLEKKTDATTVQEKVNTVFSIMQDNFALIQEKFKMDEHFIQGAGYVEKTVEITRNNHILNALKSKKVTPQSYICIANELLKSLGISKVQNEIVLAGGLTEPEISIPISNNEYIVLNGITGITEKKERLPQADPKTDIYYGDYSR